MITKFKIFEKSIFTPSISLLDKDEPKLHDYVVASNNIWTEEENRFVLSHIGQIVNVSYVKGRPLYRVEFEEESKMPNYQYEWGTKTMVFWRKEIIHWSKNKEDLIEFVELNADVFKYNI
jgi:hypothetical protein